MLSWSFEGFLVEAGSGLMTAGVLIRLVYKRKYLNTLIGVYMMKGTSDKAI
jgi:hypothetical protein